MSSSASMDHKVAPSSDIAANALSDLLRDIVAKGRKPVETPDIADAVAVHDLRKELKRWRAILRLIAPTIGEEAERMRIEARDLAREMAIARDGRAALEAFADLGDDLPNLPARARATIKEKLAQIGARAEAASVTPLRKAQIGELWTRAATAIADWPLERFDRMEAARQLAASYRRVCRAIPPDWSKASPEALHRLRQRVVEHRYQMELSDSLWPKLMRVWISEAQRMRDRLGAHQDLEVLRRMTGLRQPLAHWHSRLVSPIAERQAVHVAGAQRLAGRLFAEKPKAFRRRLAALWEHRAERPH